jgi:MHS family citrate/tricarballylate:H+ symporter-like MFS transporter
MTTASPRQSSLSMVLRVTSGNFLEMFDFFLYGFTPPILPKPFSPAAICTPR